MIRYQPTAAILAILSLLTGNVAGWVHVHDHMATAGIDQQSVGVDVIPSGCCHSHDGSPSDLATSHDHDGCGHDGSHQRGHHHNSDDCAVCQLLFTVRDAAPCTVDVEVINETLPLVENLPIESEQVDGEFFGGQVSARGPPTV